MLGMSCLRAPHSEPISLGPNEPLVPLQTLGETPRFSFPGLVVRLLIALLLGSVSQTAGAKAADPDFYGLDPSLFREAFPEADGFGPREGMPPAWPAYRDDRLVGYVFSSHEVVETAGYSAKPLDLLVGLDLDGLITGAVIIEHHEPILIIGVEDRDLARFLEQYRGRDIRTAGRIGVDHETGTGIDAVSGATISSLVMNDAVLRSARTVAAARSLLGEQQVQLDLSGYAPATWPDLIADGSLTHVEVEIGTARRAVERGGGRLFAAGVPPPSDDETLIDLYAGLATPARIGRNLVGDRHFRNIAGQLAAADNLIFIAASGLYSFKGRGYRRSGIFDRFELLQGNRSYRFRADEHISIEALKIEGQPALREVALFKLPAGRGFDPAAPWRLQLMVEGAEEEGVTPFTLFDLSYELPQSYILASEAVILPEQRAPWQESWSRRLPEIAILIAGLLVLTTVMVFQDLIVKRRRFYQRLRLAFLIYTLVWLGWIAGAQLSVINVLTFLEALMTGFAWEFFLLEPLIFILWGYVAIALIFWGRGVFCGWLCPFGALQELAGRVGELLRLPRWRLPFGLHERLWPVKYIIFIALFAVFLYDPALALRGAEVEPFKTAIVLKFDRAWPFVLYALGLVVAALFVSRAYCRYLCPLGAALALPARIRMFEWLKRRWQCGKPCQICAQSCPVQAIHPDGRINPNECIHCLTCQLNLQDSALCPVLMERMKRRQRARGAEAAKPA